MNPSFVTQELGSSALILFADLALSVAAKGTGSRAGQCGGGLVELTRGTGPRTCLTCMESLLQSIGCGLVYSLIVPS